LKCKPPLPATTKLIMANPGTFADIGKEARDTLLRNKDFSTKPTLEVNTTSSNGVKATGKISKEDNGSLLGSVEVKFPKSNGAESSVTLDSANKIKFSLSHSDRLAQGLKLTLGGEVDNSKAEKQAKAGVEYKRPNLTYAATFNFPIKREIKDPDTDTPWVNTSLVLGYDQFGLVGGAEGDFVLATNTFKAHNITLAWQKDNFVTTAFYKAKAGKKPSVICGGTIYSRFVNPSLDNTEVAAEIAYDAKAEKDPVTVTFGAAFDANKDSRINATFDTKGKFIGQVTHRLNSNTKLKIGTEATLLDSSAAPKFYAGLSLSD